MLESEVLEVIKKGKFIHRECCMYKDGVCAYWNIKVDPNKLGCIQFNSCKRCSPRAVRVWKELANKYLS